MTNRRSIAMLAILLRIIAMFFWHVTWLLPEPSHAFAPRNDSCEAFRNQNKQRLQSRFSTGDIQQSMDWKVVSDSNIVLPEDSTPHLVYPGGGIYFYFQAGLTTFLREQGYNISQCSFSGASAGALTATLSAANVDFYEATDLALSMAAEAGVWDRSGGLQGIWGPLIEDWLDELLPTSIDALQGRVTLLVTPVPSFGKSQISTFKDRQDLIRCNMASVHLVRNHL